MKTMQTLTAKDVAHQMNVGIRTAYRIIQDVKISCEVKTTKITQYHLDKYIGIIN